MNLDEQIEFMERAVSWCPSPMREAILASLRELKSTQAERDQLRARVAELERENARLHGALMLVADSDLIAHLLEQYDLANP